MPVHKDIECDGCGQNPVVGLRFKCQSCDDFDLCASCKIANKHSQHSFETIEEPRSRENVSI